MSATKTVTYNFVEGWDINGKHQLIRPVDAPKFKDGAHLNMRVDFSEPVTLVRCRKIIDAASAMVGVEMVQITIHDSEYTETPGNECSDWPEKCLRDKQYQYDKRTDTLVISAHGKIIYMNEHGSILRGDDAAVAHADSLDV